MSTIDVRRVSRLMRKYFNALFGFIHLHDDRLSALLLVACPILTHSAMPLKRFFHSSRRSRRSGSSHGNRNSSQKNELSVVSLDEMKLREASSCVDVHQNNGTDPPVKSKEHPTHPIQWNSAGCLIPSQASTPVKKSNHLVPEVAKLIPGSPKRRLRFTTSSVTSTSSGEVADSPKLSRRQNHSTVRKKLSHFDDLSRLEFSADGYRLTSQQRDLLKLCWKQANCRQGEPGRFIFNWIFSRYPDMKKIFGIEEWENAIQEPRFQKHIQAFTDVLELVVSSVVDEVDDGVVNQSAGFSLDDTTGPLLHSYGARHVQIENRLGLEDDLIQPEHWDIFRTAMCEYASTSWRQNVLTALSASAQKRNEALHAWRILVYYITAKVKQGYEIEKNEQRKRGRGRSVAE